MKLSSTSFHDQDRIPESNAFGKVDPALHIALAGNANPQLAWVGAPRGTQSFALICHDPDVPSRPDDVNIEGREVPADLPRVDFYHWVLVDIAPETTVIAEGSYSDDVTPRGKPGPMAINGTRQGINSFTGWFSGDHDMKGDYFGYDGPCPPWNDAIQHRYIFTLYALDVAQLAVEGSFDGEDVLKAIQGHVLDQASIMGWYTLNPRLLQA